MADARVKIYPTTDGKIVLTVRYVAGEPRAWLTVHAPDFQNQYSFPESTEKELCEALFREA